MIDTQTFTSKIIELLPYSPNEQQLAVAGALARFCMASDRPEGVFILNGYAGTGKTTLCGALVRALESYKVKTVLLAPTGRAAKVFSANSCGHKAYTIHRQIYKHASNPGTGFFPTPGTVPNNFRDTFFIVDEASMIGASDDNGTNLLADLVEYVYAGDNCHLILLGDTAQLPPVGADRSPAMNPDVLRSFGLKVTHAVLTETARQAADSGILFNATRLRRVMARIRNMGENQELPIPKLVCKSFDDVRIVEGEDLTELLTYAYDQADNGPADTILITRSNRRATEYNRGIRGQVLYREEELEKGDMLIVARNQYFSKKQSQGLEFIANGDIVTVERVHGTETRYGLRFADVALTTSEGILLDTKILLDTLQDESAGLGQEAWNNLYYGILSDDDRYGDIPPQSRLASLRTDPYWTALHVKYAYAITCHKAQGGQWKNVFVDLAYIPADALGMSLYRWLYTAVTRAKTRLYLISPPQELIYGSNSE